MSSENARASRLNYRADQICVESFGVNFAVKTDSPELATVVSNLIPKILPNCFSFSRDSDPDHSFFLSSDAGRYSLYKNGEASMLGASTAEEIFSRLSTEIRLLVGEHAVGRVFVHSGCVVVRGRAILLPGRTHTGKSTLTAELVRRGAKYFSDEYAILDSDGMVHPFHKRISLRNEAGVQNDLLVNTDEAGSAKPGMVVITRFVKGGEWKPAILSPAAGVMKLMENTIPIRRHPEFALSVLEKVASMSVFIGSERNEAGEAAGSILKLFDQEYGGPRI
jgi:hypothetical protein